MNETTRGRRANLIQLTVWVLLLSDVLLLGWWNLLLPAATGLLVWLLVVAGGVWLYALAKNGLRLLITPVDAGMGLVAAAVVVASVFSSDPSRSWRMGWQWLACILVFYMVVTALRLGWRQETLIKGLIVTISIALFAAYYQLYLWLVRWYGAGPWPGLLPPELPRVWGLTVSPNVWAVLLNMTLFPAAAYWRSGRRPWPLLLWFVVAAPMLILPASRSAWLGLLVGGTLFAGLEGVRAGASGRLSGSAARRLAAGFVLCAGVVIVLAAALRGSTFGGGNLDLFFRTRFWRIALDAWRLSPLFGSGLNTYATHYMLAENVPFGTLFVAAHNIFMQTLSDMGVMGLGAVLGLLGFVVRALWQRRADLDSLSVGWAAALSAFFVHSLLDTPETWVMALAAVMLAALVARQPPGRQRKVLPVLWIFMWFALSLAGLLEWRLNTHYFAAVTALQEGAWDSMRAELAQAERLQRILPFEDGALLQLNALAAGAQAAANPEMLPEAAALYEAAIMLEPGWPVNYANLAALQWQAGQRAEAVATIEQGVAQAEDVPLLLLNLALWDEQLEGSRGELLWPVLYQHADTWSGAPLWTATPARAAATAAVRPSADDPSPAYFSEEASRRRVDLERQLADEPYSARYYHELGIVYLQLQDSVAAAEAFRKAAAVEMLGSAQGVSQRYGPYGRLWLASAPGASEASRLAAEQFLKEQSIYGPSRGGAETYLFTVYLRYAPSFQLLPQLSCFTVLADRAAELVAIQEWLAVEERASDGDWLAAVLVGDGDGTVSCWDVTGGRR